jgi:hypothetical protein
MRKRAPVDYTYPSVFYDLTIQSFIFLKILAGIDEHCERDDFVETSLKLLH